MTLDFWCPDHSNAEYPKIPKAKPCVTIRTRVRNKCTREEVRKILAEAESVIYRPDQSVKVG